MITAAATLIVLSALVQQFDRELEATPSHSWSLQSSPAYQKLTAIHAQLHGHRGTPAKFEPGSGASGQINGGEFPKGTWAITYDDGPHNGHTEKIMSVLTAFNIKATFFWVAQNVVQYRSVVAAAEQAGHSLQNHSYTHADLVKTTDLALGYEVSVSNQIMKEHYQSHPGFFRLPYGSGGSNSRVRKKVADEKLVSVLWNVDSLDWADKNAASVAERVRKQMVKLGRGVVLFHDIQGHTADASSLLLKAVKNLPYRYVTIPAIMDQLNGKKRVAQSTPL